MCKEHNYLKSNKGLKTQKKQTEIAPVKLFQIFNVYI